MNMTHELKIDKEFAALIPPLSAEELSGLEDNLMIDGVRDALVVWEDEGILLDGHNRYTIAKKHDLAYRVKCLGFKTRDEAKLWIIKNQVGRRNLSESQRAMCAARLATLERGDNQHTPIGGPS